MTQSAFRLSILFFLCSLAWLVVPLAVQPHVASALAETKSGSSTEDWLHTLRVPGPDHDRLNALVGTWNTAIRQWKNPDAEPVELTGTATRRWVLDERFLEERAENKTSSGGMLQSLGYLGYNRLTQLYEHVWMLSAATGMFIERGRYDPESNLIRTTGVDTDPVTGATILTTTELKIESPDRHILSAYAVGADGIRWKQLEIIYSKK
jgi:hypothetical protein